MVSPSFEVHLPPLLGRDFVFIGSETWTSASQTSKHHLAREISRRGGRVLYVENVSMRRLGSGGGRDVKKALRGIVKGLRGPRRVGERVWALSPLYLPFPCSSIAQCVNRDLLPAHVRSAMVLLGFRRPVYVYFIPTGFPLQGRLGERLSVYYIVDNFAAFSDVETNAVAELEAQALQSADVVFATSETLLTERRERRPDIHLALHGVDLEHFGRARTAKISIPDDLASLPTPRIGFMGGIDRNRMNFDLMDELARRRSEWHFVLIGRALTDISGLISLPNVTYLGEKAYSALPGYLKGFDVGIIPYVESALTRDINPIKLREYLAAGLPVVATGIPAVREYADVVQCVHGVAQFESAIAESLVQPPDPQLLRSAVAEEGWNRRADAFLNALKEAIGRVDAPGSAGASTNQEQGGSNH